MDIMRVVDAYKIKEKTHLCIGPMSVNCVDAVIEIAYEYKIYLTLIASRRQVECIELGGGYVNNWNPFSFVNYVRARDPENRIIIARDHGGPWQHPVECERFTSIDEAMESAKLSFLRDIEAGFQVLHIDPVFNNSDDSPSLEWVLDKVYKLYKYCIDTSDRLNKEILIEIGTEEQGEHPIADLFQLEQLIDRIFNFCEKNGYKEPTFIVVQTGSKVMGMKNIGDFPTNRKDIGKYIERYKLNEIINICEERGIKIKEHNADYLADNALLMHPKIGIHAVNVAPEFGVTETISFMLAMEELSASNEINEFIEICVASRKWEKWVIGLGSVSDLYKTKVCGHYLFSDKRFIQIKGEIREKYAKQFGKDLDVYLKEKVKESILRYLKCFNTI